jgi:LysR family transcriptional activator of nhaA
MDWINYHHLLYFWVVVREGSIAKACGQLHLTQPTISAQIRALEHYLGEKLFVRSGRRLVPTEIGRLVFRYADEIFTLGRELTDTLKGRPTGHPVRLVVGITDAMPKLIAHRLLEPALRLPEPVRLVCREGKPSQLFAEMVNHGLDLVLSDAPAGHDSRIRAFSHLLGECGVTIFSDAGSAARLRKGFPKSLEGAPFLLPAEGTALRRSLDQWFDTYSLRPQVAAEIEDSALVKTFGAAGLGAFAAPTAIEDEIRRQHRVQIVGRIPEVVERFYAISVERRLKNPAVVAISEAARATLLH